MIDVDFNDNSKDIAAYRKKRHFGGGYVYTESLDLNKNKIALDIDGQSRFSMLNSQITEKALSFNPKTVKLGLIFKTFKEMKNHPENMRALGK